MDEELQDRIAGHALADAAFLQELRENPGDAVFKAFRITLDPADAAQIKAFLGQALWDKVKEHALRRHLKIRGTTIAVWGGLGTDGARWPEEGGSGMTAYGQGGDGLRSERNAVREQIAGAALIDESFRLRLRDDPREAARSIGIDLSEDEAAEIARVLAGVDWEAVEMLSPLVRSALPRMPNNLAAWGG